MEVKVPRTKQHWVKKIGKELKKKCDNYPFIYLLNVYMNK